MHVYILDLWSYNGIYTYMYVCVACISRKVVPINAVEYFKIFFYMWKNTCNSTIVYLHVYMHVDTIVYIYIYICMQVYILLFVRACVYAINLSRKYAFKLHFTVWPISFFIVIVVVGSNFYTPLCKFLFIYYFIFFYVSFLVFTYKYFTIACMCEHVCMCMLYDFHSSVLVS